MKTLKKKIAIIGATEFQNPLIIKAKRMGYETYVYAWENNDVGEKTADHFIPISVIEKEEIYKDCIKNGINTAVSIGSDVTILTANYLQRKFGKPTNPEITDQIGTNKYKMRKAFMKSGVLCPKFILCSKVPDKSKLKAFKFPIIVKPVDRSGSRGIYKVNDYKQIKEVFTESRKQSFSKKVIIEEYIDGNEYSAECISFNGIHKLLAVTKKYTTGSPHFIETGHDEPSGINKKLINKIEQEVYKALTALHIENGASHTEFKLDDDGVFHIIEIGPRMGGDCIGSDLVRLSTGYDFMKMVIDIADGNKPDLKKKKHYDKAFVRFIFTENDLKNKMRITKNDNYKIIRSCIKKQLSDTVTNSTDRHGYYLYVNNK